jgi:transcriptional regulator with XRE-family HTH domain
VLIRGEGNSVSAKSDAPKKRSKNPTSVAFGQRVAQIRLARGLTQKQLARRARYGEVSVSRLETGDSVPKIDTIVRVAKALEVDVGDLFSKEAVASPFLMPPTSDLFERVADVEAEAALLLPVSAKLDAVFDVLLQLLDVAELSPSLRDAAKARLARVAGSP